MNNLCIHNLQNKEHVFMILNEVQKLTIEQLPTDENYTIGGVSVGEDKRYEVHRVNIECLY